MSLTHCSKKTRNILYINNRSELYGAETSLGELVRNLRQFKPVVVLPHKGPLQRLLESSNINVLFYEFKEGVKTLKEEKKYYNFFINAIKKYNIDIMHLNKAYSYVGIARKAAGDAKIPCVVHVRGHVPDETLKNNLFSKVDKIICVSHQTKNDLIKRNRSNGYKKIPLSIVNVIYNGRTLETYHYSKEKRVNFRSRFGLTEKDFVVAHVGYFDPIKGQDRFIELVRLTVNERPDIKFLMIGSLEKEELRFYKRKIDQTIQKHELRNNIIMTGFVDTKEAYSGLDVLVSLSLTEGLPGTIIEAMSSQCVVVANDVGGIPEIIGPNGAGYCVGLNKIEKMKDHILHLYDNPGARKKLGQNAKDRVHLLFDINEQTTKIENVYETLLSSASAGDPGHGRGGPP